MNWTRRSFVKVSAAGVAAALFPAPFQLLGADSARQYTRLRRNVGYFTGRGGTIGLMNNLDGGIVVDSQFPDSAEAFLIEVIREQGVRPVHALINSHHHADHTAGNGVLRYTARFHVAHERAVENQRAAAIERDNEDEQVYPDTTFSDSWSIDAGDESIQVKYYGPAHTGGDVATIFENANIVHLGDLVNNRAHPNIDGPSGASVHGWIDVLEQITAEHTQDTIYIFGHAGEGHPVTGSRDDVLYQRDYFLAVVESAQEAIGQGRTRDEATNLEQLPGFEEVGGQVSRLALNIGIAYDELTRAD